MATTAHLSRQEPGQALAQETDEAEGQEMNSWFPLQQSDDAHHHHGDIMIVYFLVQLELWSLPPYYSTIMYKSIDSLGYNYWPFCVDLKLHKHTCTAAT